MARSGNRGSQDIIANGGVFIDRFSESGGDKIGGDFAIEVRLVELPLDGLDQFRRLLADLQPTYRFADTQCVFCGRFSGKGL